MQWPIMQWVTPYNKQISLLSWDHVNEEKKHEILNKTAHVIEG